MSTSEYRAVDAESELPISAAELAALEQRGKAIAEKWGPSRGPVT